MSVSAEEVLDISQRPDIWAQVDCIAWAKLYGVKLDGKVFELTGHEYQEGPLRDESPRQVWKKAAQIGATSVEMMKTLHGMIYRKYGSGALYLFPSEKDVTDFSKARFTPFIQDNPIVSRMVGSTDSANIKRIGTSTLYFRGARMGQSIGGVKATSSRLKSIPVDRVVFDEYDEMDPSSRMLALERMSHSAVCEEMYLSTPTIPDYGIDALFQSSDQRVWMIKCGKCGAETCLELEFPECVTEDGKRLCKKCRCEIHPRDGRWVAQFPGRSEELVGWWASQLMSMMINPAQILKLYRDPPEGNIGEVYNSKLGQAYIAAENRLTLSDVYECCGVDAMPYKHEGPCAMGVDVGRELHVVIGCKVGEKSYRVVKITSVSTFNDLHDLAKRYGVKCGVMDLRPEERKVRDFQAQEKYAVYGNQYSDGLSNRPVFNNQEWLVTSGRTDVMDAVHDVVMRKGALQLPRRCQEVDAYAKGMIATAKVLIEDDETGRKVYRYRKLGADHYYHSTVYMWLAAQRIGIWRPEGVRNKIQRGRRPANYMQA